jgi:hypothetical protein
VSFTDTTGGNTHTVNYYDQLRNTYQASPSSPSTWDAAYSVSVTGTVAGTSGTTGCTISTSSGGGAANCQGWFDYNTLVTVASTVTSTSDRWVSSGSNTFTQTTGGNTDSVSYTRSFGIDPNASSHGIARAASGTTATTLTIKTTNTNDLVFACEYTVNTGITQTVSSTTLSWASLGTDSQTTNHGELTCWQASAAAALGSETISFGTSGSTSGGKVVLAFAITGNSLTLDGTIHYSHGATALSSSVSFSTSFSPDIVVAGAFTANAETSFSAGGSYSLVNNVVTGPSGADESLVLSSSGSQTPTVSWTASSSYWTSFAVAIDPPAAAAQGSAGSQETTVQPQDSISNVSTVILALVLAVCAAALGEPRMVASRTLKVKASPIPSSKRIELSYVFGILTAYRRATPKGT